MYFSLQNSHKKLNEFIRYIQKIIQVINTESSIDYKIPHILEYFCYITAPKNFAFIQYCVKNKIAAASQFSKLNVQFSDKLYKEVILSNYFEKTKNPIISMVEFSYQLTNISDMYGVSIFMHEEHK